MAIPASLPPPLTSLRIEADQNSVVEPVDEALVEHGSRKLALEIPASPGLLSRHRTICIPCEREQNTPGAVARGEQERVACDHQRLSAVVPLVVAPGKRPQLAPLGWFMGRNALFVKDENLLHARERGEHRRSVTGPMVADAIDHFSGLCVVGREGLAISAAGRDVHAISAHQG